MQLETIEQTSGGYKLKNLRFIKLDNIIVGQVLCPTFGKPNLYDGYCTIQWNTSGIPIKKYKGMSEYSITIK